MWYTWRRAVSISTLYCRPGPRRLNQCQVGGVQLCDEVIERYFQNLGQSYNRRKCNAFVFPSLYFAYYTLSHPGNFRKLFLCNPRSQHGR